MIARELLHVAVTGGVLAAILAAAEWMRRRGSRPETTRKLVHVASGLQAAAFPWMFETPWSVAAIAAGYAVLMAWTERSRRLESVHGVRRRTSGGLCYPAAVALVFALAHRRPEAYVPAILVLALADAAAALVGSACGRTRYRAPGGRKSVEGSLAFFAVALPAVGIPLFVLTSLPLPSVMLWSGLVAAIACGLEALASGGTDNLLIPTGCCLVLLALSGGPAPDLWLASLPVAVLALPALLRTWEGGGSGRVRTS